MKLENKKQNHFQIPALITSLFFNSIQIAKAENVKVYSTPQPLTFSVIQKAIVIPIFKNIAFAFDKSCESKSNQEYSCGEIPFGTQQFRNNNKYIAEIVPQEIKEGGAWGIFPYNMTKITLSRSQKSGVAIPQKLIYKSEEELKTSSYFGKDFYLKLFPAKNRLYAIACMYMPGVTVNIPEMTGFVDKTVSCWFDDAHYRANIATNSGQMSFDSVKTCVAIEVETSTAQIARNMPYKTKILAIEKPHFVNLQKASIATSVNVQSSGGFCSFFTDLFGANGQIKKAVQQKFSAQINKQVGQLQDDYTDGTWLSDYITKKLNNKVFTEMFGSLKNVKVVDNIGKEVTRHITSDVAPLVTEFKNSNMESVYTACSKYADQLAITNDASKSSIAVNVSSDLHAYCENLKGLSFLPYRSHLKSSEAGCYKNWSRLTDLDPNLHNTIADLQSCRVEHQLSLSVDKLFVPLTQCYLNSWTIGKRDNCNLELKTAVQHLQERHSLQAVPN